MILFQDTRHRGRRIITPTDARDRAARLGSARREVIQRTSGRDYHKCCGLGAQGSGERQLFVSVKHSH